MDERTRRFVRRRAEQRCEYCQLSESQSPLARLQIEHIVPRKHGGTSESENLALACIDCNLHKGSNLTGIDPDTGNIVKLFDPRFQSWADHFAWGGVFLNGQTSTGRTTIRVQDMNSEERLRVRLAGV